MAERKLVVVHDSGILQELGGIGGPITTPTRIPIDAILKMINNKRHVYECYPNDPRNPDLRVQLTQANYKSDNFKKPDAEPVDEVSETPEVETPETPVVEEAAKEQEPQVEATQNEPNVIGIPTTEQEHTNDSASETPEVETPETPVVEEAAKEQEPQVEATQQSKPGNTTNKSKKKK